MKHKTKEELQKLNDKRLLAYYKVVRSKTNAYINSFFCDCCGELCFSKEDIKSGRDKKVEIKMKEASEYLQFVKDELETRGHIER